MADRLSSHFGPASEPDRDPVEELVLTILSQNTTDANRDRAYASLLSAFGSLEAVAGASEEAIAEAIRIGGLQAQKSRTIRGALRRILAERGVLSIEHLRGLTMNEAMAWLTSIPGVGSKTAGIVCLFCFDLPYLPIDTHIRRVLTRLGWIEGKGDPHARVNAMVPKDSRLLVELHLQLIRLGRTICSPKTPHCDGCPLRLRCKYGQARTNKEIT